MELDFDRSNFYDKMDRALTQGLFWEYRHPDYTPTFTTKAKDIVRDGVEYISLKKIYMEIGDITEYEFAIQVFDSWDHWQKICNSYILKPLIAEWRAELEINLRSQSIMAMKDVALNEGSKGAAAAKWLAEGKWKGTRGRPSKEEVERERKIHAGIDTEIDKDFEILKDLH